MSSGDQEEKNHSEGELEQESAGTGSESLEPKEHDDSHLKIREVVLSKKISRKVGVLLHEVLKRSADNLERVKERLFELAKVRLNAMYKGQLEIKPAGELQEELTEVQVGDDDLRAFLEKLVEEKLAEIPELRLTLARSQTPSIVLDVDIIERKQWLPPQLLEILRRPDVVDSVHLHPTHEAVPIRSFVSLLDVIDKGYIQSASDPSNIGVTKYVGEDYGRTEVEDSFIRMMNGEVPDYLIDIEEEEGDHRPVYAVLTGSPRGMGSIEMAVEDADAKLAGAFHNIIFVFAESVVKNRSTFTVGDSANGGLLNSEGENILIEANNIGVEGDDISAICQARIALMKERYPDRDFVEIDGKVFFNHNHNRDLPNAVLSSEDGHRLHALIEILKDKKIGLTEEPDYAEAQIFGQVNLESDVEVIVLHNDFADMWDKIKSTVQSSDPELYLKIQALEESGKIRFRGDIS